MHRPNASPDDALRAFFWALCWQTSPTMACAGDDEWSWVMCMMVEGELAADEQTQRNEHFGRDEERPKTGNT